MRFLVPQSSREYNAPQQVFQNGLEQNDMWKFQESFNGVGKNTALSLVSGSRTVGNADGKGELNF